MFLRKTGKARRGDLILLQVWVRGLDVVADAVRPDQLGRLIDALHAACEAHAKRTGGSLTDAQAGADHARMVCAWIDGHRRTRLDVPRMVRGVAAAVRDALVRTVPDHAGEASVEVTVTVGECAYVQKGKKLSDPMGDGVLLLLQMSRRSPRGQDVILIHDSVKGRFPSGDLEDLGDGMYAVVN